MRKRSGNILPPEIWWQWQEFGMIGGAAMHELLALRQEVFVVEQRCAYLDADEYDRDSYHLTGRDRYGKLVVYARLNWPGGRFSEPSIGRLLTTRSHRRRGLAGEALAHAIDKSFEHFPGQNIRISAQLYLKSFYARHGFMEQGQSYLEDGIEHIDMVLQAERC